MLARWGSGCIISRQDETIIYSMGHFFARRDRTVLFCFAPAGTGRCIFVSSAGPDGNLVFSAGRDGEYPPPRLDGTAICFLFGGAGRKNIFPSPEGEGKYIFSSFPQQGRRGCTRRIAPTAGCAKRAVSTQTWRFSTRGPSLEK